VPAGSEAAQHIDEPEVAPLDEGPKAAPLVEDPKESENAKTIDQAIFDEKSKDVGSLPEQGTLESKNGEGVLETNEAKAEEAFLSSASSEEKKLKDKENFEGFEGLSSTKDELGQKQEPLSNVSEEDKSSKEIDDFFSEPISNADVDDGWDDFETNNDPKTPSK
jgi:hypothetical protein